MIKFTDTETSLTLQQINDVELYTGLLFPNEYKEHLLKYNGGQCFPDTFSFIENNVKTDSSVDWFLAIYDGEDDNLVEYINTYKIEEKRIPNRFLPIAHDSGGNLICISCGSDDLGKIYFWDHENESEYEYDAESIEESDYSNIFLIANSLNEFLANLKD